MSDERKWRWALAWATMILLASGLVMLTIPSLRIVGAAILVGYFLIVFVASGWSDFKSNRKRTDQHQTGKPTLLSQVFGGVATASPYGAYYLLPLLSVLLAPVVIVYVFAFMPLRALWRLAKRLTTATKRHPLT